MNNICLFGLLTTDEDHRNEVPLNRGSTTYKVSDGMLYINVEYTAKEVSTDANVYVTFYDGANVESSSQASHYKSFHIKVNKYEPPQNSDFPIFVKTGQGWKHKDRITEFNPLIYGLSGDAETGYIHNSRQNPYIIYAGESLELFAPRVGDHHFDFMAFENSHNDIDGYCPNPEQNAFKSTVHDRDVNYDYDFDGNGTTDGIKKIYYSYDNLTAEYTVRISYVDTSDGNAETGYIYVKVYPRAEQNSMGNDHKYVFNHCDIEIAENGTYTFTNSKGEKYVYKAVVSGVKKCVLTKDGQPIRECGWNGEDSWRGEDDPKRFIFYEESDYVSSGTPGSTQFEFTSAFDSRDVTHKTPNGRCFRKSDIFGGEVTFTVNLTLTPDCKIVEENGRKIQQTFTGNPINVKSVDLTMSGQSIVDAFNKCPDHSGLDFTFSGSLSEEEVVDISTTTVNNRTQQLQVAKKLVNTDGSIVDAATFNSLKFEFQFLDMTTGETNKVQKSSIGSSGTLGSAYGMSAVKLNFEYCAEGRYPYIVSEIIPADTKGIVYSDEVYRIDIIVKYQEDPIKDSTTGEITGYNRHFHCDYQYFDSSGNEIPRSAFGDAKVPVFTNILNRYELPSTGGAGGMIFYIVGGTLMTVSILIPILRKRKER